MEVILLERVEKLGLMGDVVTVKPGFARNYLLPQKKALRATKENIAGFEEGRSQFEAANIHKREEAESISPRIDGLSVVLVRQASDNDQLYGSVTTRDIAKQVTAAGFTVDRDQIQLERPIKTVGLHPVRVRLHPEVFVTVTANVARTEEEAEAQARGERPGAEQDEDDAVEAAVLFEDPEQAADATAPDGSDPGSDPESDRGPAEPAAAEDSGAEPEA